jgi:hypothetical protein
MRALVLIALLSNACVIASDHVSTELHRICTEDVPLPFERTAPRRAVAEVEVEDVGATIDSTDAQATLDWVSLEAAQSIDDFAFADAMEMDLLAPGRDDARVAELEPVPGESPMTADGDREVDLVDYLTAERLAVRIAITGDVPDPGFLVTMSACIDVEGIVVED